MGPTKKRGTSLIELCQRVKTRGQCLKFLQELRPPDGSVCPKCSNKSTWRVSKQDFFRCNKCRDQFSATSDTILHRSHLGLRNSVFAPNAEGEPPSRQPPGAVPRYGWPRHGNTRAPVHRSQDWRNTLDWPVDALRPQVGGETVRHLRNSRAAPLCHLFAH